MPARSLTLTVNGEPITTTATTVAELVESRVGANTAGVAVAIDSAVVPRSNWERTLETNDVIDILTAVQGG